MKRLLLLGILALCFVEINNAHAQVMNDYCTTPPFVNTDLKPNVLVILDNSNSMDEDFFGNAAGSFNSTDKLVIGKKALRDIITRFKSKLRLGVASFKVGSGVSADYIHNSPYFASYQVKSYCPNPPPECVDYCKTGNLTSKATCTTSCQALNAAFDPDYFDTIITANAIGSATRNKYCNLVYPKTQFRETEPVLYPGIITYYKQSLPFYDGGSDGIAHCYSAGYSTAECASTTVGPFNSYTCYYHKTDNSDTGSGYLTFDGISGGFSPTDSDVAAGYKNFGRRLSWWVMGRTWFKNSSAGDGYIHVNVDDLVNIGGSDTTTFTNVMAKLDPKEGDEAGYMSCASANKDTCPYIISAGLTPTTGTFQTAINHFQGASSPIQYKCQNNYVIFVTDGLPSTDESGVERTSDVLMPGVLSKISALRAATKSLGGHSYTFDIKTYILGVGLTQDAKLKLDDMATAGGTADAAGHAYYADNPTAMSDALTQIFEDIIRRVSSGTAASVLASSEGSGANIVQAVFYPRRIYSNAEVTWTGELRNLWYYIDPYLQATTMREDTEPNKVLHLIHDYIMQFYLDTLTSQTKVKRYSDTNGDGSPDTLVDEIELESVSNIWEAASTLWARNLGSSPRTIYTTLNGSSFLSGDFSTTNASALRPYLNAATDASATAIINYVHGIDQAGYRSRTVTIGGSTNVWKLGDIITSTPRIQSTNPINTYHLPPPDGYSDSTYLAYIKDSAYLSRGMAYAGANDGMLHAFKLGTLEEKWDGQGTSEIARLTGSDLGKEMWAFIPKNVLPYLKYMMETNYCHLYMIDNPSYLVDASVYSASGINQNPTYAKSTNSWRTILIGGMGLGGACRNLGDSCTDCVKTPVDNLGYSSYFALDVTNPSSPQLLWEFSNPALGFSTSGPAVLRIGDASNNGKWFVVFASGPTGGINTVWHQFMAKSDQNLKLFVVDLYNGSLLKTIDTGIANAFGGSLYNSMLDVNRGDKFSTHRYSDDVFYLGYTKKDTTAGTWTKGGILRVYTNKDLLPDNWTTSQVVQDIGPVSTAVAKLQDRTRQNLWLYFGTGRFFYKNNYGTDIDDADGQRTLYGVKEPCYTTYNTMNTSCFTSVNQSNLTNQTSSPQASLPSGSSGWLINLDASDATYKAERVITDPLAIFSGITFFTTFKPSTDPCELGGSTQIWALNYGTGGAASSSALNGRAIFQVSTGEIKELTLGTAFSQKDSRRTTGMQGVPPRGQGLSVLIGPRPLRKIMHIQEK